MLLHSIKHDHDVGIEDLMQHPDDGAHFLCCLRHGVTYSDDVECRGVGVTGRYSERRVLGTAQVQRGAGLCLRFHLDYASHFHDQPTQCIEITCRV